MILTHGGVYMMVFGPLRDVWCFWSTRGYSWWFWSVGGMILMLLIYWGMILIYWGYFCHFWIYFWIFLCTFSLLGTTHSLAILCVLASSFFFSGYEPFFFLLFIPFISLISSHSLSFQLLFFLFLYKSFCPLSHSPYSLTPISYCNLNFSL